MNEITQHCSFCGKEKSVVKKLIVSDSVAICNNCVDLCLSLLKDPAPGDVTATTTDDHKMDPMVLKAYLDQYIICLLYTSDAADE